MAKDHDQKYKRDWINSERHGNFFLLVEISILMNGLKEIKEVKEVYIIAIKLNLKGNRRIISQMREVKWLFLG